MNADAPSLTERVSHHLARPVEASVRTIARWRLLDWLACVAGARRSEAAAMARAAVPDPVMWAAYIGNVLEMDDVYRAAVLHPGPVVWPAALAGGAGDMAALLDAGVRGCEAMIAIGATFDAYHYAHYHPTATAGVFGAAAVAASLDGLEPARTASALGLAGSVAGGLWRMRHEPGLAKQWHVAHAVTTGRAAAAPAAAGAAGPRFILEGEQGLYAATTRAPKPLALGEGWLIGEVSVKPWGACRHTHPAIDAALWLKAEGKLDGPIHVATYRDALVFCDRPDPRSVIEAKFSLQHAVAVVAARGEPRLADFEPDAIAALAEARSRVIVAEDPAITARYPDHFGACVRTAAGAVTLADTLGDPERPLAEAGLLARARALMDWGGVGIDADAAIASCLAGEDPGRIVALLERWR